MKKILSLLIITSLFLCINPNIAYAQTTPTIYRNIEYINDDIYIETIIIEHADAMSKAASSTTKTASKISYVKNSNDEVLVSFKLTGTFIYNHSTSSCTNVTCTTAIFNDNWEFTSTSATKSGISAIGNYTAKCYVLGIEATSVSRTVTISCDAHGNVY